MPGVLLVREDARFGSVVEDLLDLALFSLRGEWNERVVFAPLT